MLVGGRSQADLAPQNAVLTLAGCFEGPLVLLARPDLKAHRARREITEERLENETA
jgi:hypothetical protein